MAKFVWILSWLLLAIAFLAGPFSLYLAACGRFWKNVGTIILGIMIGVSGLFLSLIAAKMRYQELEEAGNKITNDIRLWSSARRRPRPNLFSWRICGHSNHHGFSFLSDLATSLGA